MSPRVENTIRPDRIRHLGIVLGVSHEQGHSLRIRGQPFQGLRLLTAGMDIVQSNDLAELSQQAQTLQLSCQLAEIGGRQHDLLRSPFPNGRNGLPYTGHGVAISFSCQILGHPFRSQHGIVVLLAEIESQAGIVVVNGEAEDLPVCGLVGDHGKPPIRQHGVDAMNAQPHVIQYGSIEIPDHVGIIFLILHNFLFLSREKSGHNPVIALFCF